MQNSKRYDKETEPFLPIDGVWVFITLQRYGILSKSQLELNGPGGRAYGDGMYVATSAWNGRKVSVLTDSIIKNAKDESLCYGYGSHTLSEMTWTRPPKIIKQSELWTIWDRLPQSVKDRFGRHPNTYACALGYDAMYCDGPNYMVIWNRSIIAIKKQ